MNAVKTDPPSHQDRFDFGGLSTWPELSECGDYPTFRSWPLEIPGWADYYVLHVKAGAGDPPRLGADAWDIVLDYGDLA